MTLAVCDHAVDFEIEGLSVRHAKGAQLEFFLRRGGDGPQGCNQFVKQGFLVSFKLGSRCPARLTMFYR